MTQVTFGDLAKWRVPDEEEKAHKSVIKVLHEHFPPDWESWEVTHLSFEQLFGDLSADTENRLRFAIPTAELILCFDEKATSVSERKFKYIKRMLLKWPLGRALIYAPHAIMEKLHSKEHDYIKFMDTVKILKQQGKLISRQDACAKLGATSGRSSIELSPPRKRSWTEEEDETSNPKRPRDDRLINLMKGQQDIFNQLLQVSAAQLSSIAELNNRLPPLVNKTDCQEEHNTSFESVSSTQEWASDAEATGYKQEMWQAPQFQYQEEASGDEECEETLYNFDPITIEAEPKIGNATALLAKQVEECQRLNTNGWMNIKYTDIQKKFQATPVFSNLKINSLLANVTPAWQQVKLLEKIDLALEAITHGLLQERQEFQEIYDKGDPKQKAFISKHFLSPDSKFRKTSDTLLQYVCGKRAETLQQRRSIYKSKNRTLNELLHSIPPSTTHLFSEKALSDLVKEHDGPNKFFRFNKNIRQTTSRQTGRKINYTPRPYQTRPNQTFKPQQRPRAQGQPKFQLPRQPGTNFQKGQQRGGQYRRQNKL